MKKLLPSSQCGFTLIEALIAALVVAVVMLGLANLQGVTLLNSADSRMRTHALNLAQDKIEELRSFANQNTYAGMDSDVVGSTAEGINSTFTRTWEIDPCLNSVNCKQATVTVEWTDAKNAIQTVQLTSYIAQTDPVKSGMLLVASSSSTSSSSTSSGTTSSTSSTTSSTSSSSSTGSTSSSTTSTGSSTGSTSTSSSSGGGNNCTLAGEVVMNGDSVAAYESATVPYGSTCTSESRHCTSGTLSGSYDYTSCTVQPGATCTFNGSTVASGASVTAYQSAMPTGACVSESRTCTNGALSGSYTTASCTEGCTLGGSSVASGGSITAFQNASVTSPATCVSQSRVCANGSLSGSYTNLSCAVTSFGGDSSKPDTVWSGTNNPKNITWPAVTGATQYKIYSCTVSNKDELTFCDPAILDSTSSSTGYAPGNPGNKDTLCIKVVASNGSTVSTASAVMCIYRFGNEYSYQP